MFTLPDGSVRTRDAAGRPLNVFSGCGVMAEFATLHVDNVVKAPGDVPLDRCALVGCGVMTGFGAACNTAKVWPGAVAVVFGAGGVGLNAIQGCAISGAATIVAVDTSDAKLDLARTFGATHVVNASREDNVVRTLRQLTGGGADFVVRVRRPRHRARPGLRLPAQGRHGGDGRRGRPEGPDDDPHRQPDLRGEDPHRQLLLARPARARTSRACSRCTAAAA